MVTDSAAELGTRFSVTDDARRAFERDGFVILRDVLPRHVIDAFRPALVEALARHRPQDVRPIDARLDAYSAAFVQTVNVGLTEPGVRAFTHAPRFARIAADLLGVEGIRLYCEDWLVKEPGARHTPWHQDYSVFPIDNPATATIWIPIVDVDPTMGLPRYARASMHHGLAPVENISEETDRVLGALIAERSLEIVDVPPMNVGDVAVHHGLTIHSAYSNDSPRTRFVLALHLFTDGARIKAPTGPMMAHQLDNFAAGSVPGDLAASAQWIRLWPPEAT